MLAVANIQAPAYRRREPEKEPLYQILAEHLETFLQQVRTTEHGLPLHVEKEMRAYLECGVLACGFVRLRCEECGESRAVAFSCKRRGFCTSCTGRRMADTAARLVDDVLPRVPVRQFVLSFPYEIRYRLAWDGALISAVLAVFLRVVNRWYRRQAKALGYARGRCGSVTFVQRFGSSLNVNPHIHVLTFDGVYVDGEEGPEFVPPPPLTDDDVQQIVQTSAHRIIRLCPARRHPHRRRQSGGARKTVPLRRSPGVSSGALAHHRSRPALLRVENALVQRHHAPGALTPRIARETRRSRTSAPAQSDSLPRPPRPQRRRPRPDRAGGRERAPDPVRMAQEACPHRLSWGQLIARVFDIDVSLCPACGGRMQIIAALTEPDAIRRYLEAAGRPWPPYARVRPHPLFTARLNQPPGRVTVFETSTNRRPALLRRHRPRPHPSTPRAA